MLQICSCSFWERRAESLLHFPAGDRLAIDLGQGLGLGRLSHARPDQRHPTGPRPAGGAPTFSPSRVVAPFTAICQKTTGRAVAHPAGAPCSLLLTVLELRRLLAMLRTARIGAVVVTIQNAAPSLLETARTGGRAGTGCIVLEESLGLIEDTLHT